MQADKAKTLRLLFAQWQGGNMEQYYFGSELLSWLAPAPDGPVERVDVEQPTGVKPDIENGIVARSVLLRQADHARALIEKHQPENIVVFGGDCLVDLAPFAYMNERYNGDLAVLWVDAHPDVMTPTEFQHAHAMVLGNLLGKGDAEFVKRVKIPLKPQNVMYAGLQKTLPSETDFINKLDLKIASAETLKNTSEPVLQWLRDLNAKYLAVHLDLDVLDVSRFHSLYFGRPDAAADAFDGISQGTMTIKQVIRLLNDVASVTNIKVLGIAEYLPWDAIQLKDMLGKLPLIGDIK